MAAEPEPDSPRARVLLANISRDSISQATHISIVQVLMANRLVHHIVAASGPYLDAGRNRAVAGAMTLITPDSDPPALSWDWFLFVDSDIEFDLATFDALFAPVQHPSYSPTDYPVIGGVYHNPFDDAGTQGDEGDPVGPVVYEWAERDDLPGELNGTPTPTFVRLSRTALATRAPVNESWNADGRVTEISAIGTGFLAIHSSLFIAMAAKYGEPMPWFHEPEHLGVHYGEDMGFALRCTEMGYPVLAHRGVTPIHHKTMKLI